MNVRPVIVTSNVVLHVHSHFGGNCMYMASIRAENQYNDFVKAMQDSTTCFHLFRFYIQFMQQP